MNTTEDETKGADGPDCEKRIVRPQSWSHFASNGTLFECDRKDLVGGIRVTDAPPDADLLAKDVAEVIGFHAVNYWPELNGFAGYDCVHFIYV